MRSRAERPVFGEIDDSPSRLHSSAALRDTGLPRRHSPGAAAKVPCQVRAGPAGCARFRADRRHNRRFRAAFRKVVAIRAPYSACIFTGGIPVPSVAGTDATAPGLAMGISHFTHITRFRGRRLFPHQGGRDNTNDNYAQPDGCPAADGTSPLLYDEQPCTMTLSTARS